MLIKGDPQCQLASISDNITRNSVHPHHLQHPKEHFLLFSLQEECYAIPVEQVHHILCPTDIVPIPDAPFYVLGVIKHRGKVVPISDLRLMLGLTPLPFSARTVAIILEENGLRNGIIVDKVIEVIPIDQAEIEKSPEWFQGPQQLIRRIATHDKKTCLILELKDLLHSKPQPPAQATSP